MNLTRPMIFASLLTAANIAVGVWAALSLPASDTIGMNYGVDGQPHAFLPIAEGVVIFPVVSAGVCALLLAMPRIAPTPKGLAESASAYSVLIIGLAALFLVCQAALVTQAIDPAFDVLRWVFMAAAVMLLLLGNLLGKVRHNAIFGIRTPDTRADPTVWDKTHRFAGRAMVIAAVLLAAVAAFYPNHVLLIAALVLASAGPPVAGAIHARRLAAAARPG